MLRSRATRTFIRGQQVGVLGLTSPTFFSTVMGCIELCTCAGGVNALGCCGSRLRGRKPVLIIGVTGLAFSMISFGLSRAFWALVVSRSIAGALCGNVGVIKCSMTEICDDTNLPDAIAYMNVIWLIGGTIGSVHQVSSIFMTV